MLPPAQKEVEPVIVGVNVPTATLALPFEVQPFNDAVTLMESGEEVPEEKVIEDVPCPFTSVAFDSAQVYVAPATGLAMLAKFVLLFAQTDDGALMPADGGALTVTGCVAEVPVQPAESVTVTL